MTEKYMPKLHACPACGMDKLTDFHTDKWYRLFWCHGCGCLVMYDQKNFKVVNVEIPEH